MRKVLFKFSKSYGDDLNVHIEEWLEFPMTCTVFECSLQLASVHSIPEFAFGAFHEKLSDFISNENSNDFKDRYLHLVNNLKLNALNIEKLCSDFDSANHNDFLSSSKLAKLSDQQIFTHTFNRMIHSPAAQDFVHLEKSFAVAVGYELHKRNDVLKEMDQKHINETERGLQKRGSEMPETITQLQEGYYLKREIVESHWDSCISALKWEQRQALRKFVMSFEDHVQSLSTNNSQINFSQKDMKDSSPKASQSTKKSSLINNRPIFKRSDHIPLSETFTVQLGRQLRTVFNFRLTRMDPSELITDKRSRIQENHLPDENALAERMNNALNIYSNNLNGLVILVDKGVNSFRGIKRLLAEACEQSTELHFPELGSQLESIQETVNRLGPRKLKERQCASELKTYITIETSTTVKPKCESYEPVLGDVLISKHSNLISGTGDGINVIFHMVLDEDCENNIRIPSPLHCAISAILRTCFDYDITTLSLPLLLVPSLSESMDSSWRAKRVETVLKAVKGALMELITWRGLNLRSIQFLAPSYISDEELNVFRQIISNSFLQLNPLIGV